MPRVCWLVVCLGLVLGFAACKQANVPPQATDGAAGGSADAPNSPNAAVVPGKIYPHSDEFKKGGHGAYFIQDRASCTRCHGRDYSGPNEHASCRRCHGEKFPHPAGWALPENHGAYYKSKDENGRANCRSCHQSKSFDAKTKTVVKYQHKSGVYCVSCHEVFPHNEVIADDGTTFSDDGHDKFKDVIQTKGLCLACHKPTDPLPDFETGCVTCHADQTLKLKWEAKTPPQAPATAPGVAPEKAAPPSARHKKQEGQRSPSTNKK